MKCLAEQISCLANQFNDSGRRLAVLEVSAALVASYRFVPSAAVVLPVGNDGSRAEIADVLCEVASRDDDGARHHREATGGDDDGTRLQCEAIGRDDACTRRHSDATIGRQPHSW